jgi:hypothetical protein
MHHLKIIILCSDISTVEENNVPFFRHPTFDEELGTTVIGGEFLGYVLMNKTFVK